MLSAVPATQSGIASGALNAMRQTGGAVGVAVFGALMATDIASGIRVAVVVSALLLLATAMISLAGMRGAEKKPAPSATLELSLPSSAR